MIRAILVIVMFGMFHYSSAKAQDEWTAAKYFGYDRACQLDELVVRADAKMANTAKEGDNMQKLAGTVYARVLATSKKGNLTCMSPRHRRMAIADIVHGTLAHHTSTNMEVNKILQQLTAYAERYWYREGWEHN